MKSIRYFLTFCFLLPLLCVTVSSQSLGSKSKPIKVGVMLPLHDNNGDGRRMVEYYRGVLMACDSLRYENISVDVSAWNVSEEANIETFLVQKKAAECDLIIGPLYSKQVKPLSDFAMKHDIKVLIPFSIQTNEVATNDNIFQVYQSPQVLNETYIKNFVEHFKDYHTVIIDCNDSTSHKGMFTSGLRNRLQQLGRSYNITNVKSSDEPFSKAFHRQKRNVVVLNTGRAPELTEACNKLNVLTTNHPDVKISLFGYNEWFMYVRQHLEDYYKYDAYIPSYYFYDMTSPRTKRYETKYRWNFHEDPIQMLPRFGITGFDHAYFFLKGLAKHGKAFKGKAGSVPYTATQTPLYFERFSRGGYQNRATMFVHYTDKFRTECLYF